MADTESLVNQLGEYAERRDFNGALKLIRDNRQSFEKGLQGGGVRDALKKTTNDRLLLSFLDSVEFGERSLEESLSRLEKLVAFSPDSLVLSKAWGLGTITKLDYFYKRMTVDFRTKKGHQFTFAAAADMLEPAPADHILVFRQKDPAGFDALIKDRPGEFVKKVLMSYGALPVTRLEDVCVQNGFVKAAEWKSLWDRARAELRRDKLVEIPAKRADPITLKASEEDYGDVWMTALSHETDPKRILASVCEYIAGDRFKSASEETKSVIGDRLAFAATAVRKVDDALYARLACKIVELGFSEPPAAEMREYLWERKRYIKAAAALPTREIGAMIDFLACDAESREKIFSSIPELCFSAVSEIADRFGGEPACRAAFGELMKRPKAPATLVALIAGRYEKFREWTELPPLITVLSHAIALGEGRQSGETLKMQNTIVRRLFADRSWLAKVFNWLEPADQELFFERFQASIAWDPSTHHTIVVRMSKIVPALEKHLIKTEKKKMYARVTSFRSFWLRKCEYLKLINEDMPANIRRIEAARSYGDLSENAEYQYAKDEQRALMQKQSVMQEELETVKPGDFSDATTDEVMPGVTVVVRGRDGEKAWTILGEWDNDPDRGVISSRALISRNMMGKKAGDDFELPGSGGEIAFATIVEIRPISDEIREWMKLPEGAQI